MQSVRYSPVPPQRKPVPSAAAYDPMAFWRQRPRALHERIEVLTWQIGVGRPATEPPCALNGANTSWEALHEEEMILVAELRSLRSIRDALRRERELPRDPCPVRKALPSSSCPPRKPLPPPPPQRIAAVARAPGATEEALAPPPAAVRRVPLSPSHRRPVPTLPASAALTAPRGLFAPPYAPVERDRPAPELGDDRWPRLGTEPMPPSSVR